MTGDLWARQRAVCRSAAHLAVIAAVGSCAWCLGQGAACRWPDGTWTWARKMHRHRGGGWTGRQGRSAGWTAPGTRRLLWAPASTWPLAAQGESAQRARCQRLRHMLTPVAAPALHSPHHPHQSHAASRQDVGVGWHLRQRRAVHAVLAASPRALPLRATPRATATQEHLFHRRAGV